ncbi:MAG: polysaccharide biosynthesis protein, partial [Muribaculaceae bacterium]|nr:polysaccharide biosynthesis protein [Muribaculaceae bacterium]
MRAVDKAVSWYFSRQALPYWTIILLDSLLIIVSGITAYGIAHGALAMLSHFEALVGTMAVYVLCYLVSFRLFHTYMGVMRLSSFVDLRRLGLAIIVGMALSMLAKAFFDLNDILIPFSDELMAVTALLSLVLMWTTRIAVKTLYDLALHTSRHTRVFILGTKEGGLAIANSINDSADSPYAIEGFISSDTDMVGKQLMGHTVYPLCDDIVNIMRRKHSSVLMVSPLQSEMLRRNTALVDALMTAGIKIMMLPAAQPWDHKHGLSYTSLHEVNVEELLPRDIIEIDMDSVGNLLSGKRILITGAAGSIGSEMARQIAPFKPAELILVDQAETPLHDIRLMMAREWPDIIAHTIVADIANQRRMEEVFSSHSPEYVFHAAAYKHVPMMEDNPAEAIENNVNGTRIIADLAVKHGTRKFVMVSTDKAVNPTNVMGCSKRICEIYVQALDKAIKEGTIVGSTQFVTTRFGNVLGSNGSVIPLFEKQIKAGGPVTVTHPDIIRFFMLIPEACKL